MVNIKKCTFGIVINNICPNECDHCQYSCTLEGGWMSEKLLDKIAYDFFKHGFNNVHITGGEPFYDLKKLESALDILLKYFKPENISVATSGFFATDKNKAIEYLKILNKRKIPRINLSVDRFHLKTVPWSNIIKVLEESQKLNIQVVLRPVIDLHSQPIVDKLIALIKKYKPHLFFSTTSPFGRAEDLDFEIIKMRYSSKKKFVSKLKRLGLDRLIIPYHGPTLSVFPNGAVYWCCFATKLSYMGKVQNESTSAILKVFKKTLLGSFMSLGKGSNCVEIQGLLQNDIKRIDSCDLCKNQPFTEDMPPGSTGEPYIKVTGRSYVKITMKDDFDKLFNKLSAKKYDFLISFDLAEQDLTRETGRVILNFLEKLKSENIKFKLSKPLPRCLFEADYARIVEKFRMPRNCFECNELFTFYDNKFIFCNGNKIPKPAIIVSRSNLFTNFSLNSKKNLITKCKDCLYAKRKICEGIHLHCLITD